LGAWADVNDDGWLDPFCRGSHGLESGEGAFPAKPRRLTSINGHPKCYKQAQSSSKTAEEMGARSSGVAMTGGYR
jgi:hypothetical protein